MMYKQCSNCKKRIKVGTTCECVIEKKRKNKNDYQKKYYKENKEQLKLIKTAKWSKLRMQIIKRDNGFCRRCYAKRNEFVTENLQVHHIKPRVDFPELVYDDTNLVTVCKQCNLELGTSHSLDFEYNIKKLNNNL